MSGNTWPEYNYVYEWVRRHNIEGANHPALLELAEEMTKPRLQAAHNAQGFDGVIDRGSAPVPPEIAEIINDWNKRLRRSRNGWMKIHNVPMQKLFEALNKKDASASESNLAERVLELEAENKRLVEANKCSVCGDNRVVCERAWLREKDSLEFQVESLTKSLKEARECLKYFGYDFDVRKGIELYWFDKAKALYDRLESK